MSEVWPEYQPRKLSPNPRPFSTLKSIYRYSRTLHLNTLQKRYLNTTTVYHLHPPTSLSTAPTWIIAATNSTPTLQLLHPLTLKPHLSNLLPLNFNLIKFQPTTLAVSYHTPRFSNLNKLLVFPHPKHHGLVVLFNDAKLKGWLPYKEVWRYYFGLYDDIFMFKANIYALYRGGKFIVITTADYKRFDIVESEITIPFTPDSGLSPWRKRVVVDAEGEQLYLVTRMGPRFFHVYKMVRRGMVYNWVKVKRFDDRKVLFLSSDYHFFMPAGENFHGMHFENCLVFSELAFPWFDDGSWRITQSEDDIAVFRLDDGTFDWEGDNAAFPKLNWSPPLWVFNAFSRLSQPYSQSESEPDEDKGLDSNSKGEDDEDVQSDSIDQDEEQEGMESDSEIQDEEDRQTQCDLDSQEKVQNERRKKMSGRKLETRPSKEFSHETDKSAFKSRHHSEIHTTTIYGVYPPDDLSSCPTTRPWITAAIDGGLKHQLRHPLTLKHLPWILPTDFDLSKLRKFTFINAVFHLHTSPFDKLLVVPIGPPSITPKLNETNYYNVDLHECTLLALYDGGRLRGCPRRSEEWVRLSHGTIDKFDDVTLFRAKIYALDREGKLYEIFRQPSIGKTVIDHPVVSGSGQFGWRKRLVVEDNQLHLVVRVEEKLFQVYKWVTRKMGAASWNKVQGFDGNRMLFIARDHYFWLSFELSSFPGKKFEDCIIFSEAAFPRYGKDCWEVAQIDRPFKVARKSDEDLAVFWLDDETFVREGENDDFLKLNWSPPPWIFHVWSVLGAESQSHSPSESYSQSKRESEEDEDLDSNSRDLNDGKMQSVLIGQYKAQEMESDSDSHDQDRDTQCDLNTRKNEDEQEVTKSLLSMNGGNDATEQGTSMRNITHSIPRACTSCTIKSYKSDSSTTKFEGFDVRPDLMPTLQKIWRNHGNIIENSTMRSGDIVARALESLATMVRILEDNSAQSLSGAQADYLSSTLSDLRFMGFKVYWLIPFVKKAVKLHKNKHLLDSLNYLSELSSQVKVQRVILLDELAKLDEKENKLKEEMEKMSKTIPFSEKFEFDKPIGCGLT